MLTILSSVWQKKTCWRCIIVSFNLREDITMPTSAVYQPTTVTYEQQPNDQRWNCPMSYFSRRVTSSLNRTNCVRIGLCLLGSTLFIVGKSQLLFICSNHFWATKPFDTPKLCKVRYFVTNYLFVVIYHKRIERN